MFRRRTWFPILILAAACGGTNNPPPPPPDQTRSDIPQAVATQLGGSLQSGSTTLAASDSLASLSAELAALAIQAGVQLNDVTLTVSLMGGLPDRAALSTGKAQAFGFQSRGISLVIGCNIGFVCPVTVAMKACCPPEATVAELGETVTEIGCVPVPGAQ